MVSNWIAAGALLFIGFGFVTLLILWARKEEKRMENDRKNKKRRR